jgi:hypothetical protein
MRGAGICGFQPHKSIDRIPTGPTFELISGGKGFHPPLNSVQEKYMRGKFLLAASFVAVALALPSTSVAQATGMDIGVTGGVNLATISGDEEGASNLTAFMAGVSLITQVTPMLHFQPEILWSRKGSHFKEGGEEGDVKINYIEVPLLLKIRLGDATMSARPALFVGPYVGYKIGCTASFGSVSIDCDDPDFEADLKSLDYGATVGAGLDFGNLGLFARYSMGLTNIGEGADSGDSKHRVITIGARWSFSPMR